MLVFSYAVELDVLDPQAEGYAEVVRDAAKAYRSRALCLESNADKEAAQRDWKRAASLEAKVKKNNNPSQPTTDVAKLPGRVTVGNEWADSVTIVIAGVRYSLAPGESRTLATPSGSFAYELQAGPHRSAGTIEAGRTYRVRPPSLPTP